MRMLGMLSVIALLSTACEAHKPSVADTAIGGQVVTTQPRPDYNAGKDTITVTMIKQPDTLFASDSTYCLYASTNASGERVTRQLMDFQEGDKYACTLRHK